MAERSSNKRPKGRKTAGSGTRPLGAGRPGARSGRKTKKTEDDERPGRSGAGEGRPASKRAGKRPPAAGRDARAGAGTRRPGAGGRPEGTERPPLREGSRSRPEERGGRVEQDTRRPSTRSGPSRPFRERDERGGNERGGEGSGRSRTGAGDRGAGASRGGPRSAAGRDTGPARERPSARAGASEERGEERRPSRPGERTRDASIKRHTGRGPDRTSKRGRKAEEEAGGDGLIRLNRYLAQSGVASRREADDLIKAGVVSVNGQVVTEMGTKVGPGDKVHYGGQRLSTEQKRYVLVNKPKNFITTTDDPADRRTVMALIDDACRERLYPVGRLDRNTTGVLLMTNDGDLAKKLTHPSHGAEKIYHVTLDKSVVKADLERLVEGIELEDGQATADEASYVDGTSRKEVGLKLHMGKNRIVRRMFEALGYEVIKLDRVVFAGLTKKDVPRGKWRHLTEKEVLFLKRRK